MFYYNNVYVNFLVIILPLMLENKYITGLSGPLGLFIAMVLGFLYCESKTKRERREVVTKTNIIQSYST